MALGETLDHWVVKHPDEMSPEDPLEVVRVQMAMLRRLFGKDAEIAGS